MFLNPDDINDTIIANLQDRVDKLERACGLLLEVTGTKTLYNELETAREKPAIIAYKDRELRKKDQEIEMLKSQLQILTQDTDSCSD